MISKELKNNLSGSSWVRKMFEEGEKLRAIYGADKVYDFSLGNPEFNPPVEVKTKLKEIVNSDISGIHKYMNNAGFSDVRLKIAENLNKDLISPLGEKHIIMTCGAAGGLNIVLKTILNPEEEVIVFAPFFGEYKFYASNYGGKCIVVPTLKESFQIDLDLFEKSINEKTKAVIINSPNNPTGVIYSEDILKKMADIIDKKEKEYGSYIFLLSDEPYSKIVYDGIKLPVIHNIFKNSIIINSYSKSLSLPGERVGYLAINSKIEDIDLLFNGLVFANRTLGYVNAPALFQKVIADCLDATVDVEAYKERRDILYNELTSLGFSCIKPEGAFYLFPKSLIEDDVEFVLKAKEFNILLSPGSGFGCPGYFRLSYCVSMETIKNSLEGFRKLAEYFNTMH